MRVIVVDCVVVSDRWAQQEPAKIIIIIIRHHFSVWAQVRRSVGEWFIKTQCVSVCVGVRWCSV